MPTKSRTATLATIDQRIAQLTALRAELILILESCGGGCIADCNVLESLGIQLKD